LSVATKFCQEGIYIVILDLQRTCILLEQKKDNIIKSMIFGGNKTQTVQPVLQMQKVFFCPEYIKSFSSCNLVSSTYTVV
jgi:hypothetical protein